MSSFEPCVGWTFMSTDPGYAMVDMNVHPTESA
jgi:hypothetical protein